jgi:hypothetical protein
MAHMLEQPKNLNGHNLDRLSNLLGIHLREGAGPEVTKISPRSLPT